MGTLTFYGAAGTVTGSCHLFRSDGYAFLLDCGQFQGPWDIESRNYEVLGFPPTEIDGLILSHGHLDHCGRIPRLTRQGFNGHIYSTAPTRDIGRLILLDSAHVLKEEFLWKKRRLTRAGLKVKLPLYSMEDVYYCLDLFDRPIEYDTPVALSSRITLTLKGTNAGHILGSTQVQIDYPEPDGTARRLLYTGDLGDGGRPLEDDPSFPERPIDTLIMETTYGNREHRSYEGTVAEFEEAVTSTVERKGTVLIPTFALERSQEILYHLGQMKRDGTLAPDIPVFLNSPLAIDITRIYLRHFRYCRSDLYEELQHVDSPFIFPGLHLTETVEESRAIHNIPGPKIVLAGSGMMTGGRIKHHLKHLLWQDSTTVIIVGFQARETLGRRIVDGAEQVRIFGEPIAVKARIYTINGFSAHAGRSHLVRFAVKARPRQILLVHGEPEATKALAEALMEELPGVNIVVAEHGQTVSL